MPARAATLPRSAPGPGCSANSASRRRCSGGSSVQDTIKAAVTLRSPSSSNSSRQASCDNILSSSATVRIGLLCKRAATIRTANGSRPQCSTTARTVWSAALAARSPPTARNNASASTPPKTSTDRCAASSRALRRLRLVTRILHPGSAESSGVTSAALRTLSRMISRRLPPRRLRQKLDSASCRNGKCSLGTPSSLSNDSRTSRAPPAPSSPKSKKKHPSEKDATAFQAPLSANAVFPDPAIPLSTHTASPVSAVQYSAMRASSPDRPTDREGEAGGPNESFHFTESRFP
ncbi:hypothetical protein SRIMHP_33865 [Streptomyces rimosus subsp. rimosus]|nr:hypothetical protein SRIMHP_33865 [Streptomyces rimosus subsp. rimosus]